MSIIGNIKALNTNRSWLVPGNTYKLFNDNTRVQLPPSFMVANDFNVELEFTFTNTHTAISTLFSTHDQFYFWVNMYPQATGDRHLVTGVVIGGTYTEVSFLSPTALDGLPHTLKVEKSSTQGVRMTLDGIPGIWESTNLTGDLDVQTNKSRIGSYLSLNLQFWRGIINKILVTDRSDNSRIAEFNQASDYEELESSTAASISGPAFGSYTP